MVKRKGPPYRFVPPQLSAPEILRHTADHIAQRAASRDLPQGERSMSRAVAAFNALTGHKVSERDGWLFMVALKASRATAGAHNADDYQDMAAYAALAGECADAEAEAA
jgi:hypothetical protein